MPIHEVVTRILAEIHSAWRFRWYGALAAWALCLLGWAWVIVQPNIYEATARVYVDASSVLRPVLDARIVLPDIATQLSYVRQALLGREQLERVVEENGLDAGMQSEAEREMLFERLRNEIQLATGSSTNSTYTITYRHTDRDKAIGVVRTLLNSLVETTLGATQENTDTAQQFLDDRIREYEGRLQQAETALAEFKKRNADRLPGSEGGYFERMSAETEALEAARKELRLAETRRDRLIAQLNSETPVVPSAAGATAEPSPNSLDARIRDLRLQLDQLLLVYTDKHPDVVNARESLKRLEQQRGEQLAVLGVQGDVEISRLDANPIYQSLRIALNDAEVEIDTLQEDIRDRSANVARLQSLVDEVPEVEAELARLNRDYNDVYDYYRAVRSRETQDLSRKASDSDDVDFNVIDPPRADIQPVAPNRLIMLAAVFVIAVGGGGAVPWLIAQLKPVFSTVSALRVATGLPVLGAISQAWEKQHRTRRRVALLGFAGVMACLGILFIVVVAVEAMGPGIRSLVGAA